MYVYFDTDGHEIGTSSSDMVSMNEAHRIEVKDYDGTKQYSYVDGVISSQDKVIVSPVVTEAELALSQCQNNRRQAYPAVEAQLDYIYHNGVEAWKTDMIDPVKAQYPKP